MYVRAKSRREQTVRAISMGALVAYPMAFLWASLSTVQALPATPTFPGPSDLLGLVRVAQISRWSSTPFGLQYWTNAADGESLVSVASASQSLQIAVLWSLGRAVDPFLAANIFVLLGWVLTGFATYFLCRAIGVTHSLSILGALLAEMLPALQLASSSWPSFSWSGAAVVPLGLAILGQRESKGWMYIVAAAVTASLALWDPYLYYFALACALAFMCANFRSLKAAALRNRSAVVVSILSVVGMLFPVLAAYTLGSHSETKSVRQAAPVDVSFLEAHGGLLPDYINPPASSPLSLLAPPFVEPGGIEYGGVVVTALAVFGALYAFRRRQPGARVAAVAAALLVAMSLKTMITTPVFAVMSPSVILRFLMPGALYFGRASIVAQLILCALAAYACQLIIGRTAKHALASSLLMTIIALAALDLAPFSKWALSDVAATYHPLLQPRIQGSVLFAPNTLEGRSWLQQAYVGQPMYNSLYNDSRYDLLRSLAGDPNVLACTLRANGVTDVLSWADEGQGQDGVQTGLKAPAFQVLATASVPGYGREIRLIRFGVRCASS